MIILLYYFNKYKNEILLNEFLLYRSSINLKIKLIANKNLDLKQIYPNK